jgi:ribonuclease HII
MGILIGMDEAGYGPNLGPLVVAATVWEVGQERGGEVGFGVQGSEAEPAIEAVDLYKLLRGIVSKTIVDGRIAIADSKKLHQPRKGLRRLEHGLHTVLAAMGQGAACWSELVESCAADPNDHHAHLCWHSGFDCKLPVDVPAGDVAILAERLREECGAARVRPIAIRARFVFPAQLGELSEVYGNKSGALSHVTIGLLREVIDSLQIGSRPPAEASSPQESPASSPQPPVFAVCDKHGARNRYGALLQHHFPEHWISTTIEENEESRYEWGADESSVCVAFRAKAERFLPTALASMTAKYLRELSMRAFNEFWCARVEGLRPTAGYPLDARRFKQEIESVQQSLGVDDGILWRKK